MWSVLVFIHQSASGHRRLIASSPCSYRHSSRLKPAVRPTSCLPICSCPQSHFLSDKHGRFMWSSSVWHHFLIFLFPALLMGHNECFFFFPVCGEAGGSGQTLYSSIRTEKSCIVNYFSVNSKMFKSITSKSTHSNKSENFSVNLWSLYGPEGELFEC